MIPAIAQSLTFYAVAFTIGTLAIVGNLLVARWQGRRLR